MKNRYLRKRLQRNTRIQMMMRNELENAKSEGSIYYFFFLLKSTHYIHVIILNIKLHLRKTVFRPIYKEKSLLEQRITWFNIMLRNELENAKTESSIYFYLYLLKSNR
jgi:hypothetical protein